MVAGLTRLAVFGALALTAACVAPGLAAAAGTLRIGLQEDPDALDPAQGVSFVGRVVFAGLCDKLVDIDKTLAYVPQLATQWAWSADTLTLTLTLRQGVVFQDGENFDAAAVKANIERYKSAPESKRKTELKQVSSVEIEGPYTVRLHLSEPYAPLLGILSDRAGMMLSPKALAAAGDKIAAHPVCAGPYRFVERVAQDRIVLEKFDKYWNADAIKIDKVIYLPVPDQSVRLANLRAGGLEVAERIAPTDLDTVRTDSRLKLVESPSLGYYQLLINTNSTERANTPLGKNPKVREALEAAIDRKILNQVVFNGEYIASNQPVAPGTTYYARDFPVPERDVAKAKRLLAEAGTPHVAFSIIVDTSSIEQRVAEIIQSMAGEAGFDVRIEVQEANTGVANGTKGNFDTTLVIWSGRPDPDGNISIWLACDGFLNWGKYCDPRLDDLLAKARHTTETGERAPLYNEAAAIYLAARSSLFLYHLKWIWGTTARLDGFAPYPDGIIRLQGMVLRP
ncbi:MAG: ABC transporter substrate-binding protein [Alphaproteobacteria bacterium]|nr:ABC transporter substrate-binding protein [Alphaproteobacteria bacterium]